MQAIKHISSLPDQPWQEMEMVIFQPNHYLADPAFPENLFRMHAQ